MLKKAKIKIPEIFEIASLLKKTFPQVKIKIKKKNEFIEIYFSSPVDPYKIEELKVFLNQKYSFFKIRFFLQKN